MQVVAASHHVVMLSQLGHPECSHVALRPLYSSQIDFCHATLDV
jgi:hypothetical protein